MNLNIALEKDEELHLALHKGQTGRALDLLTASDAERDLMTLAPYSPFTEAYGNTTQYVPLSVSMQLGIYDDDDGCKYEQDPESFADILKAIAVTGKPFFRQLSDAPPGSEKLWGEQQAGLLVDLYEREIFGEDNDEAFRMLRSLGVTRSILQELDTYVNSQDREGFEAIKAAITDAERLADADDVTNNVRTRVVNDRKPRL